MRLQEPLNGLKMGQGHMLIHLSFFFASLSVRKKFFSDGHYVGEELDDHRLLAASAAATTDSA